MKGGGLLYHNLSPRYRWKRWKFECRQAKLQRDTKFVELSPRNGSDKDTLPLNRLSLSASMRSALGVVSLPRCKVVALIPADTDKSRNFLHGGLECKTLYAPEAYLMHKQPQ